MSQDCMCLSNFIGGHFLPTKNYLDSFNPATGQVWAKIPDSGDEEVNLAVEAAKTAFPIWSGFTPQERSNIILKAADLFNAQRQEFATAESRDQGKPIEQAEKMEMARVELNLRHFANSILYDVTKAKHQENVGALHYVSRDAVGVAGLISPWNLPLYLLTFKLAPAIATGNTVVCKPSEFTSVTAWKFCKLLKEAGLPDGVVNMVFGTGLKAGEALVNHKDVALISFTGSTATGKRIYRLASENYKKISLEMGGKNANIVFEDANLEECIATSVRSAFLNQGEICLCTSRMFIQRSIYNKFLEKFLLQANQLKVGNPLEHDTFMGPLISKEHLEKVKRYVQRAVEDGATVWTAQNMKLPENNKNGYFMAPTVITDINDDSVCMNEEIFGPVVCIVPFDSEQEVIQRANSVNYGLCASLWSQSVDRVHRVSKKLQVGTVWANCWLLRCLDMPFGGVKHSGIGYEGTEDSLHFFTNQKTVCIKYNE